MFKIDSEKINRFNFKSLMRSLAYPGEIEPIVPVFDSYFLGVASSLLYSEVSYFYEGKEEMDTIKAITNSKTEALEKADYIFCEKVDANVLSQAKCGTFKDPDFSAMVIFTCKDFKGLHVKLKGAGINGEKTISLPIEASFVTQFNAKNKDFPLGVEVYFLSQKGEIIALSRTTKMEVA